MRRLGAVSLLALVLGAGGCSLGGDDENGGGSADRAGGAATATGPEMPKGQVKPGEPPEAAAIRGWSDALNSGRYSRAASFFARDAIVDQGQPIRLPDRSAAVAFNRSLPCHATVTQVKDEGRTVVAAFKLRPGSGPKRACDSNARVRFRFSGHKFTEWRQLLEPEAAPGQSV
ncbi:MAG TPA: nuclear transport factor 2 family protein [Thermoleophilaceae bacterium]|nr:nuclear transport factor 2 family protein [Thermoleophilaceae bacterium]